MRTSQAALAWITNANGSEPQILVQWNDNWHAYSLIGGHVEAGETFCECALREAAEELECDPSEINVDRSPCTTLQFRDYSISKREETEYHWQVFFTCVNRSILDRLPRKCAWVTPTQIHAGFAADGKPIADQVRRVLNASFALLSYRAKVE